jgi:hypothetical protein
LLNAALAPICVQPVVDNSPDSLNDGTMTVKILEEK